MNILLTGGYITNEEKFFVVLVNIYKMLIERGLINVKDEQQIKKNIFDIIKKNNNNNIYKFYIDNPTIHNYYDNNIKYILIKFINSTNVSNDKKSELNEFIKLEPNVPKILIVQNINIKNKIKQNINNNEIEIFIYSYFGMNIVDHHLVSKHILLTENEKNDIIQKYIGDDNMLVKIFKKNNKFDNHDIKNDIINNYGGVINKFAKIFTNDAISMYYNAKAGDLFRIIRNDNNSGHSIYYRYVIDN
jgi:DNA-directed RNA polymerase subunit H (RpoH/RPB5)